MARATTPTHFHSSELIRVLADLALLEAAPPGAAFAQRLGLWVNFTDAIALCAVQSAGSAALDLTGTDLPVAQVFAQTRAELQAAMAKACPAASADYEPYRRHYVAQQRDMEQKVAPLRALLRDALETASPALRQLAALDAAFDAILAEREARLLAALPLLLKQRFAHLQQTHALQPDTEQPTLQAPDWRVQFRQEMQTLLLAELDLRLQPALGLLEAFEHK